MKENPLLTNPLDRQVIDLGRYQDCVQERLARLTHDQFSTRLWSKDPTLWKTNPQDQAVIRDTLGWLHVAEKMEEHLGTVTSFVDEVRAAGFRHVVHMGMGGSSMAPLVFQKVCAPVNNALSLTVLDTTDPATILEIERSVPLEETLFIVASKSGTTAEPLAFGEYFLDRVKALKGSRTGENFVAITDPNTKLVHLAQEQRFRHTFLNFTDIGGRYSALSYFGLVPAALTGVNVTELLAQTLEMVQACASSVPAQKNPGVILGSVMGELALRRRDKVTFLMPEPLAVLGMWLEQLIAESTGKEGTGILPVVDEPLGDPSVYGADRLFVYIRLRDKADRALERGVAALRDAGHPVVTIQLDSPMDLGQEFFHWEIATATAGAVLGINPFDQPNVQESKNNTNRLLNEVRQTGTLPEPHPTLIEGPLHFYADQKAQSTRDLLSAFFTQARPHEYISLQAYLTEEPSIEKALQDIRMQLRDSLHLATTVGYGPRFLHSTGQLHKGGPNTGLFLQLTADDPEDAHIPGQPYTFGVFKRAQALGDMEALRKYGRRVVRVHLSGNVHQGLAALGYAVQSTLR